MGRVREGESCYKKSCPGAYGDAVVGKFVRLLGEYLVGGKTLHEATRKTFVDVLGINLLVQDGEVSGGDSILLPGGDEELVPSERESDDETLKNLAEELCCSKGAVLEKVDELKSTISAFKEACSEEDADKAIERINGLTSLSRDVKGLCGLFGVQDLRDISAVEKNILDLKASLDELTDNVKPLMIRLTGSDDVSAENVRRCVEKVEALQSEVEKLKSTICVMDREYADLSLALGPLLNRIVGSPDVYPEACVKALDLFGETPEF